MGYCSDVCLVTTKAGWEKVKSKLSDDPCPDSYNERQDKEGNTYAIVEWSCIKWYGDFFDEVDEAIATLQDDEPYDFVRIGEEWGDVDSENHVDYNKYPNFPYIHVEQTYSVGLWYE